MFSTSIQPGTISLFSSTGSDPLGLFTSSSDSSLPEDSFVHFLHDTTSQPLPASPAVLISHSSLSNEEESAVNSSGYTLDQTVLHIQSPTLTTTYIRCPPSPNGSDLGLKHPWIHIQVRNMGREWSFEFGLVDQGGRMGAVRCSTFQKQARLKLPQTYDSLPLLHLPLSFPLSSSHPLTDWSTIDAHIPSLLPHFSSRALLGDEDDESCTTSRRAIPSGTYSHVSYLKVYATCRLRRIWFSEFGPGQKLPWEFELYGTS